MKIALKIQLHDSIKQAGTDCIKPADLIHRDLPGPELEVFRKGLRIRLFRSLDYGDKLAVFIKTDNAAVVGIRDKHVPVIRHKHSQRIVETVDHTVPFKLGIDVEDLKFNCGPDNPVVSGIDYVYGLIRGDEQVFRAPQFANTQIRAIDNPDRFIWFRCRHSPPPCVKDITFVRSCFPRK